jgi:transcriptional regulator with XRE-family HTH domain
MASGSSLRRTTTSDRLAPELADLLLEARGDRSRTEVAAAAGVHANTLADLERGRANPTLAYLEAIGPVYGIRLRLVAEPAG